MPYSYDVAVANGSTDTFSVPFPYLKTAHVHVKLDGIDYPDGSVTWLSPGTIKLAAIPPAGTKVRRYRSTPAAELIATFTVARWDNSKLNLVNTQLLYLIQEGLDRGDESFDIVAQILEYLDTIEASIQAALAASTAAVAANAAAQAALTLVQQLRDEVVAIVGLQASAVVFTPTPGLPQTNVQAAIAALDARDAPGMRVVSYTKTAPPGCLKANGAVPSLTAYPRLAAIYCGDAENPTADWGYRCTDPLNPSTSRSTSGGYIVLPDERGDFSRGWDDGRGVDSGRSLYKYQAQAIQAHNHPVTDPSHVHPAGVGDTFWVHGLNNVNIPWTSNPPLNSGFTDRTNTASATTGISIQNAGGPETRPRNTAALICIRY